MSSGVVVTVSLDGRGLSCSLLPDVLDFGSSSSSSRSAGPAAAAARSMLNTISSHNKLYIAAQQQMPHFTSEVANATIPKSFKAFYFEVRIENVGDGICFGLVDAANQSYEYYVLDGRISCWRWPESVTYAEPKFRPGATIGCFWNLLLGTVCFTIEAQLYGVAFKNVRGNFSPFVGLTPGASVVVNFGQTGFRYNVQTLVPSIAASLPINVPQALAFSSEAIYLLRLLIIRSETWREAVRSRAIDTIRRFLDEAAAEGPSGSGIGGSEGIEGSVWRKHLSGLVAIFELLGANVDHLRVGGRVKVRRRRASSLPMSEETYRFGTIAKISEQRHQCQVVLDEDIDSKMKITRFAKSDLLATQEVPVAPDTIGHLMSPAFAETLVDLISRLNSVPSPDVNRDTVVAAAIRSLYAWFELGVPTTNSPLKPAVRQWWLPKQLADLLRGTRNMTRFLSYLVILSSSALPQTYSLNSSARTFLALDAETLALRCRCFAIEASRLPYLAPVNKQPFASAAHRPSTADQRNLRAVWGPSNAVDLERSGESITLLLQPMTIASEATANSPRERAESSDAASSDGSIRQALLGELPRVHMDFAHIAVGTVFRIDKDAGPNASFQHWVPEMAQVRGRLGMAIAKDAADSSVLLRILPENDASKTHRPVFWFHYRSLMPFRQYVGPDSTSIIDFFSPESDLCQLAAEHHRARSIIFSKAVLSATMDLPAFEPIFSRFLASHPRLIPAFYRTFGCYTHRTNYSFRRAFGLVNATVALLRPTPPKNLALMHSHLHQLFLETPGFHNFLTRPADGTRSAFHFHVNGSSSASLSSILSPTAVSPSTGILTSPIPAPGGLSSSPSSPSFSASSMSPPPLSLSSPPLSSASSPVIVSPSSSSSMPPNSSGGSSASNSPSHQLASSSLSPVPPVANAATATAAAGGGASTSSHSVMATTPTSSSTATSQQQGSQQTSPRSSVSANELMSSFEHQLVADCTQTLWKSLRTPGGGIPTITIESQHPYISQTTTSARQILLEGAENLLVVFSWRTALVEGQDSLEFYLDAESEHLIGAFSGRGPAAFFPFVVPGNRLWIVFRCTSKKPDWGFRFEVSPALTNIPDPLATPLDHALGLFEFFLSLEPKTIQSFYKPDVFQALIAQLDGTVSSLPLDRRIRIAWILRTLLQRWDAFLPDAKPDLFSIQFIKKELRNLIVQEQAMGTPLHSAYLQSLMELCQNLMHLEACVSSSLTSVQHESTPSSQASELGKLVRVDSAISNSYTARSSLNTINSMGVSGAKTHILSVFELCHLMKQYISSTTFPPWFVKAAFLDLARQTIVEDSPHPYPKGVRVTASVRIPEATSLVVEFDYKCLTAPGTDFVMFSRERPGGNDIGSMTANFGGRRFQISGNEFVWSFASDSEAPSRFWGFRFTVVPEFPAEIASRLQRRSLARFEQAISSSYLFTREEDCELVAQVDALCSSLNLHLLSLRPGDLSFEQLRKSSQLLRRIPVTAIEERFIIINHFARLLGSMFSSISLHQSPSSAAVSVAELRDLIFYDVKSDFLNSVLLATESPMPKPQLVFTRVSTKAKSKPLALQALEQLVELNPVSLRGSDVAFFVHFANEGAQDQGGPYRELITSIWEELLGQKDSYAPRLFLPCPNAVEQIGDNRDTLLPNPDLSDSHRVRLMEMTGLLIGICIRTRQTVSVPFPPIIWKLLVELSPNLIDLAAVDLASFNALQAIRSTEDRSDFDFFCLDHFTAVSLDGRLVPVVDNGHNISVTFDNRLQYATALEHYRLAEFSDVVQVIRSGIGKILPLDLLMLFTWKQLQSRVCGVSDIDIELLASNTIYVGVHPSERHIVALWSTLQSLSCNEKVLFLRFVWGRSTLPTAADFSQKFNIRTFHPPAGKKPDDYLPISSTCTFTLALPNYSKKKVLRERLLYAISSCHVIDRDFVAGPDIDRSLADSSQTESEGSLF